MKNIPQMLNGEKYTGQNSNYMDIKNLSIIRQTFANTVFTHKVQEIACEFQEKNAFILKVANIVAVGIVLIVLLLQVANPQNSIYSYIGSGITVAEILFLIIQLTFSFEQKAILHKNVALKFMGLRDEYRSLIADVMNSSISIKDTMARRNHLQREYQVICDLSPQTGSKEYIEAQKRLNRRGEVEGEQFTWSDEEIDRFLPEKLRLKNEK